MNQKLQVSFRAALIAAVFSTGYLFGTTQTPAQAQLGEMGKQMGSDLLQQAADSEGMLGQATELGTTIVETHVHYENGPWTLRALAAVANVDDAREFNQATAGNLAEELEGYYVELGYDLCAGGEQSLVPFVRYENIDTQASLPSGFSSVSEQDDEILTIGINYKPIYQVVFKLDYEDWDGSGDRWNFLIGYVF